MISAGYTMRIATAHCQKRRVGCQFVKNTNEVVKRWLIRGELTQAIRMSAIYKYFLLLIKINVCLICAHTLMILGRRNLYESDCSRTDGV